MPFHKIAVQEVLVMLILILKTHVRFRDIGLQAKIDEESTDYEDILQDVFMDSDTDIAVLKAGFNYAETVELLDHHYVIEPAKLPPGKYRNIMGNQALSLGLVAAGKLAKLPVFLGSYPITPASEIAVLARSNTPPGR